MEAPMQIVSPAIPASTSSTEASGAQHAEFHFASDAALERAILLARDQSWIDSCTIDRTRRTMRVVLSAGTHPAARIGLPRGAAVLH
jgi:hypothetical protein